MEAIFLIFIFLQEALTFHIEQNCSGIDDSLLNHDHVIIYANITDAYKLANQLSQFADPYTYLLICSYQDIAINVSESILPAYIYFPQESNHTVKVITHFTPTDFKNHSNLSPLTPLPLKNQTIPPYITIVINVTKDYDYYLEFERLSRTKQFTFTNFYYVDISNNSDDVYDALASRIAPVMIITNESDSIHISRLIRTKEGIEDVVMNLKPFLKGKTSKGVLRTRIIVLALVLIVAAIIYEMCMRKAAKMKES